MASLQETDSEADVPKVQRVAPSARKNKKIKELLVEPAIAAAAVSTVSSTPLVKMSADDMNPNDPYGILDYIALSEQAVVNEDRYPADKAIQLFETFLQKKKFPKDQKSRHYVLNALAEACAKGTSAKRMFNMVALRVVGVDFTLGEFVAILPPDRDNNLRVWCESFPGFADRTYALIQLKPDLCVEVQKANTCSYEMTPVGFDYANALSKDIYNTLGQMQKNFIADNTVRKTKGSRSHVYEGSNPLAIGEDTVGGISQLPVRKALTGAKSGDLAGGYGFGR